MDPLRNNDTPRDDKNLSVRSGLALLIAVGALVLMSQANYIVSRIPQVAAVVSSVLVELANTDRSAQGLGTLAVSPVLTEVARAKAEHMAANQYFAHTAPDGKTPWYWFKEKGYTFAYAGENLAIDFFESSDVNRAWMQSPTHRANIVGTQFTEIGIATVDGMYQGRPTTYVVQVFGTPSPGEKALRTGQSTAPARGPGAAATTTQVERPVRDLVPASPAEVVALATTLPTTTAESATEVLGESAGAYLAAKPAAPWWFPLLYYFIK